MARTIMIAYEFSMHRLFRAAPQHPRNPTSNKIIPEEIDLRDGPNGMSEPLDEAWDSRMLDTCPSPCDGPRFRRSLCRIQNLPAAIER